MLDAPEQLFTVGALSGNRSLPGAAPAIFFKTNDPNDPNYRAFDPHLDALKVAEWRRLQREKREKGLPAADESAFTCKSHTSPTCV